jgi:hypothetical protein
MKIYNPLWRIVIIVFVVASCAATRESVVCNLCIITLYQSGHKIHGKEENKNYLAKKVSAAFFTLPCFNNKCLALS